jgi:hypothetical protein
MPLQLSLAPPDKFKPTPSNEYQSTLDQAKEMLTWPAERLATWIIRMQGEARDYGARQAIIALDGPIEMKEETR